MICHLTDVNLDTKFFRSLARQCDRTHFPVMIGSITPTGSLQAQMQALLTPTFSLDAATRRQYPQALWRLVRLLRRKRVTLLHAHCFDPSWLGLLAARLAGIPFVFTRHHSDHHLRLNKHWHTRVDSWCARHADHVIAVSEITRQILIEIERVPAAQITVIYNGMEPLRAPTEAGLRRIKQELQLGDEPVCLMIARLHEEKGHQYLFGAIPQICENVGKTRFLLLGAGPHREALEADVQARGLEDRVHFLGWREDVPELIALSSLVVLPSLAESFGFALLEAMSLGKPVVAAATGGIPEVVSDGVTGLLVPPRNASALATAMCRVLLNPAEAKALGKAGRSRAAEFSFARMIRGYESVYAHVLHATAGLRNIEPVNEITPIR